MPYAINALAGRTILIAEDEYLIAHTVECAVKSAGGEVIGPYPSVAQTLAAIAAAPRLPDAAVLNVRLVDDMSFPIADELTRRGVPFTFASANSMASLPARFARAAYLTKPYAAHQVIGALQELIGGGTDD